MDKLEIAKEAVNLYFEEEITVKKAIEKSKRMCLGTDQSNQSTNETIFKNILPPKTDLDNGEVYDINTGETIREL